MSTEKPPTRRYRSTLRTRQAAETRRRVVEAALELFGRHGYQGTTFVQVARTADVSVHTVQKQGTKSDLLRAALELASFGVEGERDVFATDVGRRLLEAADPDTLATVVAEVVLAINAPSARIWSSFSGAAFGDTELEAFHTAFLAQIRDQDAAFLRLIADRGWLRTDVPFDALVEALCVTTSVESYVRFVIHDNRSVEEYQDFITRTVRETILAR